MKKNKISKDWINKRRRDIYVRQSKIDGYKSRAIYKLKEIDEKFKILKEVKSAVDLGCGDFSVGSKLLHTFEYYTACDISSTILNRNKKLYDRENLKFRKY